MYNAIKEKYPEIIIVSTAGSASDGKEFNDNYAQIDEKYPDTYVDEHYYRNDNWFYNNRDRYNADKVRGSQGIKYDRERPTRVFVGEFANNGTNNAYVSTLAEAAYYTSLEQNSDMVVMAAYAPLFCKKGFNKWNANLIWFDNRGMWRTTNYYYMKLFSKAGNRAFATTDVMNGDAIDEKVYISPTIDTESGEIYLKLVNSEAIAKDLQIKLDNRNIYKVVLEYISSDDTSIKNQGAQNYYSSYPGIVNFNYNEAIVPQTTGFGPVKKSFNINIPENSVCVIKLIPEK
jgi:hypothetical protein